MYRNLESQVIFEDLQSEARLQLHTYPESKINYVKTFIKSILKRKNQFVKDHFFWPNGLLAMSLEWSHRNNGNKETLKSLQSYYNKWIKKGMPVKNPDYTINGYSLIYLYEQTKNKTYLQSIETLINFLKTTKKTDIGSIPYRLSNVEEVLVDSLGMVCPFLCRYGNNFNDESCLELAVMQLYNFLKFGMDRDTNLPYHGYNSKSETKLGIVGWGRALGWLLIGLVDSLEYIPVSNKNYKYLCYELEKVVSKVINYQLESGDFTWQITAKEGHIDTSSTSMICYAIRRGVMLGVLPESYKVNANRGLEALIQNTSDGKVQNCSAECRGISMYPQKYSNYPWAQGPTTSLFAISVD